MMFQNKLKKIGETLSTITESCYHYHRGEATDRYIVWSEEGETGSLELDNTKVKQTIGGVVDFFTKNEYDVMADEIQQALSGLQDEIPFSWKLESVQYEEETEFIHYQWEFRI